MSESTTPVPSEDELAARIHDLSHADSHYVLFWLNTGDDADRAALAAALDAADRYNADLARIAARQAAEDAR